MATFRTSAEVLPPDHPWIKASRRMDRPLGAALADVLTQTGGAYVATTPLTEEFRDFIRHVAELTSDKELLSIAGLRQAPVSLENCRELDPQTRVVMISRLDVSPAETPRWRRIPPGGIPTGPQSEFDRVLRGCRGAHIEEHARPDGRPWRYLGPAATSWRNA
jgi:hypothetical protein